MKKILLTLALLGIVAGSAFAAPPQMVLDQFEKQFKERVSTPPAPLPDGINVVITGAGSPLNDANASEPGVAVIIAGKVFVVDAGDGTVRKMQSAGVQPGRVEALFLTHFHSDHIANIGALAMSRWTNSAAKTPLTVYGAEGVNQVVDGFNMAYAQDNNYRVAHHGDDFVPASGKGSVAKEIKIGDDPNASQVIYDQDGIKITMFNVNHAPVKPAVGYKFEYKGRSVVISGDTIVTPNLLAQTKGADVLVQDVLSPELVGIMSNNAPVPNIKKLMADIPDYHADPESVSKMAQEAGVKMLVLSHVVPPVPEMLKNIAFKNEVEKNFKGQTVMAKDGLRISLPADSTEITMVETIK